MNKNVYSHTLKLYIFKKLNFLSLSIFFIQVIYFSVKFFICFANVATYICSFALSTVCNQCKLNLKVNSARGALFVTKT